MTSFLSSKNKWMRRSAKVTERNMAAGLEVLVDLVAGALR